MLVRRSLFASTIAFLAFACADSAGGGDTTAPQGDDPHAALPDAPPAATPPAKPPAPPVCDDAHPPANDAKNCGRCGHDCLGGQCAAGECRPYAVASGLDEAPIAIALDGADVWWISNNGSIFTCPLAGCATPKHVLLTKEGTLTSIAIDATYVYYTSFGTTANAYVDGAVVRVDKSGANATTLASSQHKPGGLVVDATNVYWSETENPGAVNRCAIAGCGGAPTPIASGHAMPNATAIDGSTVYWNDQMTGEIWKHDASGTAPLLSGRGAVLATALDATSLYFAQFDAAGKIVRVSKNGANVVELATSQSYPESIAIDDTRVYWTTPTTVWSADKDTGKDPRVILSSSSWALPKSLRVDATSVVWCENGGNRVVRVAK